MTHDQTRMRERKRMSSLQISRHPLWFRPDPRRVVLRPFIPTNPQRVSNIIRRVARLSEVVVHKTLARVLLEFCDRHKDLEGVFERHFERVRPMLAAGVSLSRERRLLFGSCFTAEYALESAALFNPSIVQHPDQSHVPPGWVRFIMSFRATGEGHISSIEFRSGIISNHNKIVVERPGRFVTTPEIEPDPVYVKELFLQSLVEMGIDESFTGDVMGPLPEYFVPAELTDRLRLAGGDPSRQSRSNRRSRDAIKWLVDSNYRVRFPETIPLAERIIFPVSPNESNGIEDARFVRFTDDDGSVTYYATYTAYNGRAILPNLLETSDFLVFDVRTLNGRGAQNKGMALFPRRVNGHYAMISRQDNENLFIMFSDNLHFWDQAEILIRPQFSWEMVQVGNCGSPIETGSGWLLLTHGVGPMRKYCIGAVLLDLQDPTKVIGRLARPLLAPNASEREGYVPNVVYSCGAMVHNGLLIIPYAMSDTASSVATVPLDALLDRLQAP